MDNAPEIITYISAMYREMVRIELMFVALNDLEVKSAYILKTYVQATATEKVCTMLGSKFSPDARKSAVVIRALYA